VVVTADRRKLLTASAGLVQGLKRRLFGGKSLAPFEGFRPVQQAVKLDNFSLC